MTWHHLFFWFLLVFSAGWAFFPVSVRIFGAILPDGGLAVGRVIFLAIWTLLAFWAGNLGVSTQNSAFIYPVLGVAIWLLTLRQIRALKAEIRTRKRAIWVSETLFVAVFLAFFILRGFWSDTNGTNGEKSMDSALIGSLLRAERLPPPNPYAAGATLRSYYYFGHLQTALLASPFEIPVRWSYNLMCATLPALCFSSLFSLGAALTGRLRAGVWVSLSVLGLGTLQPLQQWLQPERFAANAPFRLEFFAVSRVIPFTINEFPFFTFNQADLHAHYFALPLALATICLGLAIYRGQKLAIWLAVPLLSAQILTNTWDFPVYALLIAFCLSQSEIRVSAEIRIFLIALVWGAAIALSLPYLLGIKTAAGLPRLLPFPASPLREWGLLWGIFAFAWLAFLAYSSEETSKIRRFLGALGVLFGLYACALPWAKPDPLVLPLIAITLGFSVFGALKLQNPARFLCFLAIGGLLSLAWSETTWAGFLGEPHHRQDTVFKFGMQTWLLWGIAASCGAALTFPKWPRALQCVSMPMLGVMAMASVAVVFGRTRNFSQWDNWDSWAHLAASEKAAASWLLARAKPGETLLEAQHAEGGDYSPYGRYVHATGIATVVGPRAHTFQWSPANSGDATLEWSEVARRGALARSVYTDFRGTARLETLRPFGTRFIIFGVLEREQYGLSALQSLQDDPTLKPAAYFPSSENTFINGLLVPRDVWIFQVK